MTIQITEEDDIVSNGAEQPPTDELLVCAARSGDPHAFVELTRRHSRRLLGCSYRITRNWQDAEDALQDSLLKAFVHVNNFERRSTFSSWITRIVINTSLMILRKKRIRPSLPLDGVEDKYWDPRSRTHINDNPEDHLAQQEIQALLEEAIRRLPNKLREIVQLHHAKEYSVQELAQVLRISVPAVKSRLSRARRALRAYLGEEFSTWTAWDSAERSNGMRYGVGKFISRDSSWNSREFVGPAAGSSATSL